METNTLAARKAAACIPAHWDAFVIYSVSKKAYYRADIGLGGKHPEFFSAPCQELAHLWAFNEASMIARHLHDCGEDAAIIKATR